MPIVAAIIGAVAVIGTTIIGSAVDSSNTDEVNAIAQRNANRSRADQLKRDEWSKNVDRWSMRQKGKEFKQGVKEFDQGVKERGIERGLGQHQTAFGNTLGLVNQSTQLRQTFLNSSQRGRK